MRPEPKNAARHFTTQARGDELVLTLGDLWRASTLGVLEPELAALEFAAFRRLHIDARQIVPDLAGAWVLRELERRARAAGLEVSYELSRPATLALIDATLADTVDTPSSSPVEPDATSAIRGIGRGVFTMLDHWHRGLAFLGEISRRFGRGIFDRRTWHPISVTRHVHDTGIKAIPIVALIAFLISVIIAYMGAQQLRKFGADIFVVDLVTVGVLREMGVLLTAIIVAGRSGSAFAAEIGAMNLNEEIDALRATGVQPVEVLVLPRCLGLVIALPLLTVIADAVGILGGALLCHVLLDMPLVQYFQRVDESIGDWTFWVGIIKAPVFALLIAIAGTYRGMQVRGSSRELGRLTTVAVVQAIFLVILADALFAVLFMEIDI